MCHRCASCHSRAGGALPRQPCHKARRLLSAWGHSQSGHPPPQHRSPGRASTARDLGRHVFTKDKDAVGFPHQTSATCGPQSGAAVLGSQGALAENAFPLDPSGPALTIHGEHLDGGRMLALSLKCRDFRWVHFVIGL